nr:hypothetical protein [Ornithinibacillus caprae]
MTETPKRSRKVKPKEEAMREAAKNYGYFALMSNEVKDPFEALSLYRSKDIAEKGFGNLKERLNFRRLHVSSELSLNGKLFIEFIALIYLSYIKKKKQDAGLFEKWTIKGLLDELDIIELLETPEHSRVLGEMTKKQIELYDALGVIPRYKYRESRLKERIAEDFLMYIEKETWPSLVTSLFHKKRPPTKSVESL